MAPDEPRFALVAREMAEAGDWLVPRLGGQIYLNKPPLLFWLQLLSFRIFGEPSEAAARLPSLLAALAAVALTHRAGRRWFGEEVATRGTLMLIAAPLFLMRGAWLATDPLLLATTLGAIVALDRAGAGWRPGGPLAGVALGLGLLAKGPVAALWVVLAALAAWRLPGARCTLRPLLRPPALAALLVVAGLPFALAAARLGVLPLLDVGWRESGQRFVASWDNLHPFWFYPPKLFSGFFPWSLLGLAALLPPVRRRLAPDAHRAWLVRWGVGGLVLFSIPGSKRLVYLFPLFPALALVTASVLPALGAVIPVRRATGAVLGLCAAAALVLGLALALAPGRLPEPVSVQLPEVRRAAAALLAAGALSLALVARGTARGAGGIAGGAALLALGVGLLSPWTAAAVRAGVGAERFGATARAAIGPHAAVAYGAAKGESAAWYVERPGPILASRRELLSFLRGTPPRAAVAKPDELGPPGEWPAGTRVVGEGHIGSGTMLVVRRDAASLPDTMPP
jgi:4-amino-4-deoxy-L-arabinose transferase-like glycosyltransferase